MSEVSQNNNSNKDEIDLLDLFRRIGDTLALWAKAIGRAFLISVVFLLRGWLPLALSIVLGIGISYFLKSISSPSYTSDMVIRYNSPLTNNNPKNKVSYNSDMISYISKLHTFCIEENFPALANALSLSTAMVNNISDIDAFWIIDRGKDGIPDGVDYTGNHNVYDTLNLRMEDRLNIRVRINSPQELSQIQAAIISFIKKDTLFQQRNRLRLRLNKELLIRINTDIMQLDSLQKVKYFEETRNKNNAGATGQMIFLQEQKTQLLYGDIYSLYDRKQTLESERDLNPDIVTVLSNFNLPAKRENGGLYYAKTIAPLVFGITLLILIIIANRKRLKEIYNKY
jgi:hypothetical protein